MHTFKDKNNKTVLLLHIPKNAGTTCGIFLSGYSKWYNLKDAFYNDHMPIRYAKNIIEYDYSIAFLRNPYNRVLSRYAYLTQHSYYRDTYKSISLEDYVNFQVCYANKDSWLPESWRKQIEYVTIDNAISVDLLYKIEEVDVVSVLTDITGRNITVQPQNTSTHLNKLTDSLKDSIYNLYHSDFKKLGYNK
jgi:hypothetical protein